MADPQILEALAVCVWQAESLAAASRLRGTMWNDEGVAEQARYRDRAKHVLGLLECGDFEIRVVGVGDAQ